MTIYKKVSCVLLSMVLSFSVFALNLDQAMDALSQAKAQGFVGEQDDGYLGVVKNEANASEIAQLINQARKAQYQKVSAETNVSLSEVEKRAGSKAQEKTPVGQYIKQQGRWLKK
ncbi:MULTISPECIES: YdbL family protein [unclassified Gilliamella]|uniref:YdbL family protein n=1 Tax=unclassified Gilliamella TaxID=2685620 RepID=UPI00226AD080|nr:MULTISPECIES: YdbL family protein [unclassified Gilliamella]MCX8643067.1 YdbL family protein [Gilliamella sp. B3835]MCX8708458.1 YdbL family protein [Gilliamella sp. B3783]MCX8709714.1 YdbL family protein [Gilliamella sp. B3780]MCX8714098.1 YdbL family protein [Gilliamella sp. B3781]MCX8717654.1 YdbL family protein [Gilliamella sp. B3784]